MKIKDLKIYHIQAGWRPWSFLKVTTSNGLIGWSECTDSHDTRNGIEGVIKDLKKIIINEDPRNISKILWLLKARTRLSSGSIVQKVIGAIDNALWDIVGKFTENSVTNLLGGKIRDKVEVYWSHCGTTRVRAHKHVKKKQIKNFKDLKDFSKEIKKTKVKIVKTNIGLFDTKPMIYMPGNNKSLGGPELNCSNKILGGIEKWVKAFKSNIQPDVNLAIDLNFNFKQDGFIKIGRLLDKYKLAWLEIDTHSPHVLKNIKDSVKTPILSGESLYGAKAYKPFLDAGAFDYLSLDVIWNGISESKKIADLSDLYEINVSPHNYNGHLSTFINMNLALTIPNLFISEIDYDDVPWIDKIFSDKPIIKNGYFIPNNKPGWGCDIIEKNLLRYII